MYCYVGDSATNGRNYYVYLNGVITSQNTEIINTGTGSQLNNTLTCIRWLTAGDVIDFRVRQNSGSTLSHGTAICPVVKNYKEEVMNGNEDYITDRAKRLWVE